MVQSDPIFAIVAPGSRHDRGGEHPCLACDGGALTLLSLVLTPATKLNRGRNGKWASG